MRAYPHLVSRQKSKWRPSVNRKLGGAGLPDSLHRPWEKHQRPEFNPLITKWLNQDSWVVTKPEIDPVLQLHNRLQHKNTMSYLWEIFFFSVPFYRWKKLRPRKSQWPHQALLLGNGRTGTLQITQHLFCTHCRSETFSQFFPSTWVGFSVGCPSAQTPESQPSSLWNLKVNFLNLWLEYIVFSFGVVGFFVVFFICFFWFCRFAVSSPKRKTAPEQEGLPREAPRRDGVKPAGVPVLAFKASHSSGSNGFYCFKRYKFTASCMEASSFSWSQA